MPLAERFVCPAQGIWRPNRGLAAQLVGAICACRFEAYQDRETIGGFECGRDLSVPTVAAKGRSHIIIPASLAFGTGEHATTAMSLRFLEQLTRRWNPGWSLADLGTGSGILALAAKCLGAGRVIGIDNDPAAISVAKSNARLNKIRGASFQLGDVHKWNPAQQTDVITANLYSDLLIEILPKLRGGGWLILSGILRSQQDELVRALQRNHLDVISMKHRGKWVAILARRGKRSATAEPRAGKFLRRS